MSLTYSWVGAELKRKEDLRHVVGRGTFVEDIKLPGMLHAAILRSPYAHAKIVKIDVEAALKMPRVKAVITGKDVARLTQPFPQLTVPPASKAMDYCMAVDKVRFLGEPVAAVAAEDSYSAQDALEAITVDYEPLEPVLDAERALSPNYPLVHEEVGSNIMAHVEYNYGSVDQAFAEADEIIEARLHYHRFSSTPIEPYGVIAYEDPSTGVLTIWCNNQMPMFFLPAIGRALGISYEKLRIITPDIGGGFGIKILSYPYMVLVALLAKKSHRPVKWIETRKEHMAASSHGAERIFYVKAAFKRDGTLLGLDVRSIDDDGAYARHEPAGLTVWPQVSSGCYKFKHLRQDMYAVFTNKCPAGPNRGFSRATHQFMLERIMDIAAKKLGLDPTEVRFKNYIRREDQPYVTLNKCVYDDGDYPLSLKKAMELLGYEEWRQKQKELRRQGRLIGIGFATTLDSGTANFGQVRMLNPRLPNVGTSEAAMVQMTPDGKAVVKLGSVPQGQSHETVTAQVVADVLGISPDDVYVHPGFDSASHPYTMASGTYASRFAAVGIGAVLGAAMKVREKLVRAAASLLEASPDEIELKGGDAFVKAMPERRLPLRRLARHIYSSRAGIPDDMEPNLFAVNVYSPPFEAPDDNKMGNLTLTYSYQTHGVVVEVDVETGSVKILKYVIVDDCGRVINRGVTLGQVQGAAAHGIGASLYEELRYDESGQLLTSTFADYLVPTAMEIPPMVIDHIEIPSPFAPLGAKGVGEGCGTPIPALINAIEDALQPFGARIERSHITPEEILSIIKSKTEDIPARHSEAHV